VEKELLGAVPEACAVEAAAMDKAHDGDELRADLEWQGVKAVVPASGNRCHKISPGARLLPGGPVSTREAELGCCRTNRLGPILGCQLGQCVH
jgi:hypothetical protein